MIKCTGKSNPTTTFPFIRFFNGKDYRQTLLTPDWAVMCGITRAKNTVKQLHKEGWAARMVKYDTTIGPVYIVYERRTGREMAPKKGRRRLYKP